MAPPHCLPSRFAALCVAIIAAKPLFAEVPSVATVPSRLWAIDFTAGYTSSRGNTDNDQYSSLAKANRKTPINETTFQAEGFYSESRHVMDAQRYSGSARYAYSFGGRNSWYHFTKAEASHDRFAQIDMRYLPSTGLGYWWSDNDDLRMMAEVGAGFEHTEYRDGKRRTNQAVAVPRFFVEKKIFGRSKVSEDVRYTVGTLERVGYRVDSETRLINPLSDRLSIDLSLIDHFNSRPPPPAKRNDLVFITALRYALR